MWAAAGASVVLGVLAVVYMVRIVTIDVGMLSMKTPPLAPGDQLFISVDIGYQGLLPARVTAVELLVNTDESEHIIAATHVATNGGGVDYSPPPGALSFTAPLRWLPHQRFIVSFPVTATGDPRPVGHTIRTHFSILGLRKTASIPVTYTLP